MKYIIALMVLSLIGCSSFNLGYDCEITSKKDSKKDMYIIDVQVFDSEPSKEKDFIYSTQIKVIKGEMGEVKQTDDKRVIYITAKVDTIDGTPQADVNVYINEEGKQSFLCGRIIKLTL